MSNEIDTELCEEIIRRTQEGGEDLDAPDPWDGEAPDESVILARLFLGTAASDDTAHDKRFGEITELYEKASRQCRPVLDMAFVALCGYRFKSLLMATRYYQQKRG